jgi:hypothetical protein
MIGGGDKEKDRRLAKAPAPVAMTARCRRHRRRWPGHVSKVVGGQRWHRAGESRDCKDETRGRKEVKREDFFEGGMERRFVGGRADVVGLG